MTDEDHARRWATDLLFRIAVALSFCAGLGCGMILHGLGVPTWLALGPPAALGVLWMARAGFAEEK